MSIEQMIANAFGYERCTLYPSARAAIWRYIEMTGDTVWIPSNVCPALATATMRSKVYPNFAVVDSHTGMAPGVPVQLYGYREVAQDANLEIDPLMTGYFGKPFAKHCIISFGRNKTLDINGGGALLSNDIMDQREGYFPEGLRGPLEQAFKNFYNGVQWQSEVRDRWDRSLGDLLGRIPEEQVIPWRVMRRVPNGKRDRVVAKLRQQGYDAGTNYPLLSGLYGEEYQSGLSWGASVINLWTTPDYTIERVERAAEIIDMVMSHD